MGRNRIGCWGRWALPVAATVVLVACGGKEAAAPPVTVTIPPAAADKARAAAMVLVAGDLPGFAVDPSAADSQGSSDSTWDKCLNHNGVLTKLGEGDRGAESPGFSKGDAAHVSSAVTFVEVEEKARSAMADVSAPGVGTCIGDVLRAGVEKDSPGVSVQVNTVSLAIARAGDQTVGYRSVVTLVGRRAATVNIDLVLLRRSRAIAGLIVSNQGAPYPDSEIDRLVSTIAGRLTSA